MNLLFYSFIVIVSTPKIVAVLVYYVAKHFIRFNAMIQRKSFRKPVKPVMPRTINVRIAVSLTHTQAIYILFI